MGFRRQTHGATDSPPGCALVRAEGQKGRRAQESCKMKLYRHVVRSTGCSIVHTPPAGLDVRSEQSFPEPSPPENLSPTVNRQ